MAEELKVLGAHIAASLGDVVESFAVAYDELTLVVEAATASWRSLTFLRDDPRCLFRCFIDIAGADYPGRERRFDVVYHLLSPRHNQRVRVKVADGRGHAGAVDHLRLPGGELVRARGLRPLRHPVHRPPGPAPAPDGLRLRGASLAQGLPAHRLRRGALRRRAEAGGVRQRQAHPGMAQLRLPLDLGGDGLRAAGGREGEDAVSPSSSAGARSAQSRGPRDGSRRSITTRSSGRAARARG